MHNHHNHPRNRDELRKQATRATSQATATGKMAVLLTAFFVLWFGAIALMVPTQ